MQAWTNERTLVNDAVSLRTVPSVVVRGAVRWRSPPEAAALLTHKSSKLVDILKVLLCYSNNFMAERIGTPSAVHSGARDVLEKLKIDADEFFMSSTSGLGANRVTPRAMMKILRGLSEELKHDKLSLSDILPVAGIDRARWKTDLVLTSRAAASCQDGTLARTDGVPVRSSARCKRKAVVSYSS